MGQSTSAELRTIDTTETQDHPREEAAVEASIHRGRAVERLPPEVAAVVAADLLTLLDTCTTRSKRLISGKDWTEAERGGALRIRFAERRAHATPQKPDLQLTEILLPLEGALASKQILVRDGEVEFSPFIDFDRELYRRIEKRIEDL